VIAVVAWVVLVLVLTLPVVHIRGHKDPRLWPSPHRLLLDHRPTLVILLHLDMTAALATTARPKVLLPVVVRVLLRQINATLLPAPLALLPVSRIRHLLPVILTVLTVVVVVLTVLLLPPRPPVVGRVPDGRLGKHPTLKLLPLRSRLLTSLPLRCHVVLPLPLASQRRERHLGRPSAGCTALGPHIPATQCREVQVVHLHPLLLLPLYLDTYLLGLLLCDLPARTRSRGTTCTTTCTAAGCGESCGKAATIAVAAERGHLDLVLDLT